jgi:hypothetical protein
VSNRRAQDERIEGTPDGSNAISEIVDVPDAPIIGTATAGIVSASVAFTPATTGGTVSLFTATSTPGSITGTSATSPITVNGLTGGTAYTFTVRGANSTGTGPASSASNSVTPEDLVGVYDNLAAANPGGVNTITFSGIPSGYKHLQVRMSMIGASGGSLIVANFNFDTGANYTWHSLQGQGTTATTYNGTGNSYSRWFGRDVGTSSTAPTVLVADILDYANTNKNKNVRVLSGMDANGSGEVGLSSSLWINTAAITSITIKTHDSVNFASGTSIALYGVK